MLLYITDINQEKAIKERKKKGRFVIRFTSIKVTMNVIKTATALVESIKYPYTRLPSKYIQ